MASRWLVLTITDCGGQGRSAKLKDIGIASSWGARGCPPKVDNSPGDNVSIVGDKMVLPQLSRKLRPVK